MNMFWLLLFSKKHFTLFQTIMTLIIAENPS